MAKEGKGDFFQRLWSYPSRSEIKPEIQPAQPVDTHASTPEEACGICLVNKKVIAFAPCGHVWCNACASKLSNCPTCRSNITSRLRIYI
jgi:E3 ubiquitin-protein ligase RGLG